VATKIGTAYVDIEPDFSAFGRRLPTTISSRIGGYEKRLAGANTTSSRLSSTTRTLGSSLATAARAAGAAAGAYLSISQGKAAVSATQDLAKATLSLHKNLGIASKRGSEWGAVAQARGVDSTKLGMAFKTLSTQVESARQGSAAAAQEFKALGVSQRDLAKGSKDVSTLIPKLADGMDKLGAGTERTAITGKLFGRGWQTLAPLMRDGAAALNENLKAANQSHATWAGQSLRDQAALTANVRESKLAWLGLQVTFTKAITPSLNDVMDQFQRLAKIMGDPKLTQDEKFSKVSQIIEDDFNKVVDFATEHVIPQLVTGFGKAGPKIAGALFKGFIDAPVLGKLAIGAWFISRLGGWGLITAIGSRFGTRMGGAMATSTIETSMAGNAGIPAQMQGQSTKFSRLGSVMGKAFASGFIVFEGWNLSQYLGDKLGIKSPDSPTHGGSVLFPQGPPKSGGALLRGSPLSVKTRDIPIVGGPLAGLFGEGGGSPKSLTELFKVPEKQAKSLQQVFNWGAYFQTTEAKLKTGWSSLLDITKSGADDVATAANKRAWQKQADELNRSLDVSRHDLKHGWSDFSDITSAAGDRVTKNLGHSIDSWQHALSGGVGNIAKLTNNALNALGAQAVNFAAGTAAKAGSKVAKKQRGGAVWGQGSGDIVPAMLEPGEFVVNREAARESLPFLEHLNSRIPRFAKGGSVSANFGGHPTNVSPAIRKLIGMMQGHFPLGVTATTDGTHVSGSYHYKGEAVDMAAAGQVMFKASEWIKKSGLYRQLTEGIHNPNLAVQSGKIFSGAGPFGGVWADHTDHIHLAIAGALSGQFGAAAQKVARVMLQGPAGALKSMGQSSLDHVWKAANSYLGKHSGMSMDVSAPSGSLSKAQLVSLWNRSGGGGDANIMAAIALAESGGNPQAINSIGAKGLWQIIPSTAHAFGLNYGKLFDPGYNALGAHKILAGQGLGAWSTYTGGQYRAYLQRGGLVRGGDGASAYDFLGYASHGGVATRPGLVHVEKGETMIPPGGGLKAEVHVHGDIVSNHPDPVEVVLSSRGFHEAVSDIASDEVAYGARRDRAIR
jgi:hypothetical protein